MAATAPLWIPAAFTLYLAGRVGTKATRVAFKYPERTAVAVLLAAGIGYLAYTHRDFVQQKTLQLAREYVQQEVPVVKETVIETPPPEKKVREEPEFAYYFAKPGDTFADIASHIGASSYRQLMRDNAFTDPRTLTAGQLLRVRKTLVRNAQQDVYARVPELSSVRLAGEISLRSAFPEHWENVLAVNRSLGLPYELHFPYRERVVHYHPEIHTLKNGFE